MDVTLSNFRLSEVFKGETAYTARNAKATPLSVSTAMHLLDVYSDRYNHWQPTKLKHREKNEIREDCLELVSNGQYPQPLELCIDAATGEILSQESKNAPPDPSRFSDYRPFGTHRYPWHMQQFRDRKLEVDIKLASLQESSFAPTIFEPPSNAIIRRQCEGMTAEEVKTLKTPIYPESARTDLAGGQVIMMATIQPDGSVSDTELLQTSGRKDLDQSALEAVRQWTYKPAMCGAEPVVSDIDVTVNFSMR